MPSDASNGGIVHRYRNKVYVRIPWGEIQYGRVSHRVTVWFRGRRYGR